ncbi:MAG TPA: type 1 glutamine amidotransferase domain-containing protein [Planctomycetaceae bacterium]|jgi:putative intracellular protease/amidase|nr:type 1 glutamine amidotransferase domain-containing protein [Planctomycetaceae bacterium]
MPQNHQAISPETTKEQLDPISRAKQSLEQFCRKPGGHGPMWDLTEDPHSIALIEAFYNSGKPVAAVCHAPGVLHRVNFQGQSIVKGKRVTGFTNGEEEAVHLTKVVPFLVEDELKRLGGLYEKGADWASFVIADGRLITGQNPASSRAGAQALLKLLA